VRRRSVLGIHIALTLLPLWAAGVVGWRWVDHDAGLRMLARARTGQEQAEQRVLQLQHALESSPPEAAATPMSTLPERQNLAEVLETIEKSAQESKVRSFQTVNQRSATPGRQTFEIQGQTDRPEELARFLALLENASRLLVVHAMEAKAEPGGGVGFTVQVAAHHKTRSDR
jgi:hypothetical protein